MTHPCSHEESHAGAEHFCDFVRPLLDPATKQSVLVAGCGTGQEALHIRQNLDIPVTGVDIERHWDQKLGSGTLGFELLQDSILDLPFADSSFGLVFYHHVIEHVSDPVRSLEELARVLAPGGIIYVGTPNRHRVVGYLGSTTASTREKLRWNIHDYTARFRRRFRNEYGAHAGYSEKELSQLLIPHFTDVHFLTAEYIRYKYGRRLPTLALNAFCMRPLLEITAAAVYAVGRKPFTSTWP